MPEDVPTAAKAEQESASYRSVRLLDSVSRLSMPRQFMAGNGSTRCTADLGRKILTGSSGSGPAVARSDKRSLTCLGG